MVRGMIHAQRACLGMAVLLTACTPAAQPPAVPDAGVASWHVKDGFLRDAQEAARQRYAVYQQLAGITVPQPEITTDDETILTAPNGQE